jgi:NAD(P)-dependent dehydrogenase (short-subunit alcohol dehydrogenase family)
MQRWLITGAGRGIGLEMTRQLLQRGDAVIGTVRSGAAASALQQSFSGDAATRLRVVSLDVRDRASIQRAALRITEPIDVLVNNAGILGPERQSTLDMDFDGFLDTFVVNAMGPLAVTQSFLPLLRKGDRPRLVNITSRMGSFSYQKEDLIAYQASKAAANKVVRGLATTLGSGGIIVIAAHPGLVRTDLAGARAQASPASISAEESAAGLLNVIDRLGAGDNGRFVDYGGREISW